MMMAMPFNSGQPARMIGLGPASAVALRPVVVKRAESVARLDVAAVEGLPTTHAATCGRGRAHMETKPAANTSLALLGGMHLDLVPTDGEVPPYGKIALPDQCRC